MSNSLSYDEYVNIMRNRVNQTEKLRKHKFKEAKDLAIKLSRFIYSNYTVNGVYVYGSVLNENSFRLDSDIDIAVLGLGNNVVGELREELRILGLPYRVDLIRLEDYSEFFSKTVLMEGKLIDR